MNCHRIPPPSFQPRQRQMHKGQAGRLLVVSGSKAYSGAPRLVGVGALAVGAGLVRLLVPESISCEVAGEDPALMITGLRETSTGNLAWTAGRTILESATGADAVVLGPGLGAHPHTQALVLRLFREIDAPMVLDADGITALAGGDLDEAVGARIFTPHPGEAALLLNSQPSEVQEDREGAIQELRNLLGGVVVLKGYGTLVYDGAKMFNNTTGNAGLAVGGTGDVLAGMIGGLLVQGFAPVDAACAAVFIHGEAADEAAAAETGQRGLTPIDLLRTIPRIVAARERSGSGGGRRRRGR